MTWHECWRTSSKPPSGESPTKRDIWLASTLQSCSMVFKIIKKITWTTFCAIHIWTSCKFLTYSTLCDKNGTWVEKVLNPAYIVYIPLPQVFTPQKSCVQVTCDLNCGTSKWIECNMMFKWKDIVSTLSRTCMFLAALIHWTCSGSRCERRQCKATLETRVTYRSLFPAFSSVWRNSNPTQEH